MSFLRKKPLRRYTPPPRITPEQQARLAAYSPEAEEYLRKFPDCAAVEHHPDCNGVATELHHGQGRGTHLMDKSTWRGLSAVCHRLAEKEPEKYKALNVSISRITPIAPVITPPPITSEEIQG